MLTWAPLNSMSFYTCGYCGVSSQDPVQVFDEYGSSVLDGDGNPEFVNDEATASAEMDEHVTEAHPDTNE